MGSSSLALKMVRVLLFFISACLAVGDSLYCTPCDEASCTKPSCCPSGYYTPDMCSCCLTCAKTEGDTCGGLWGSAGRCAPYLRCEISSGYQYYAEGVCVKRIVASLEDVPLGQEIAPVC